MAFSFLTWCLWSCPEPEQSRAFPKRLGLFQQGLITIYYHFQKLIESPTTVRQKEESDIPGPWGNLEGKSCFTDSFLILAAPEGTYWAPGATPCEEELPCRFLSHPMTLSRTGCIPAAPNNQLFIGFYYWIWCHFLAYIHMLLDLQVPLSSHDLVTDWVHPSGFQQSVIHRFLLLNMMPFPGLYSHGVGLLGFQFGNLCWSSNLNSIVNTVHTWSPHIYESYYKFSLQLEWSLSLPLCQHQVLLSVQSLSRVWLFMTPGTEAHQASLSITNPWSLLKLTSIEPVMLSNHLICCPLLLPPSIFPSIFSVSQLLTSAGQSIGVSASALVLPMNIQDWFPLGLTSWISLQSKGLSSLLQHHSSKASVLLCSAFLIVQPSHPCMITGKSIAFTKWTFVGKCLCFLIR